MWIGTNDGLNRYDGFSFLVYKNNPADSSSLHNNYIQTIIEDHNHNLLIGTEMDLSLYNRKRDSFENYMTDKSSPLFGINCTVSRIQEDSSGNIWLATNAGLIYFDRGKNAIVRYVHDPENPNSLSNNNVESVLIDKNNRIWLATRKGLNLFDPEKKSFRIIDKTSDNEDISNTVYWNIAEDNEGNIWFGSTDGLFCLTQSSPANNLRLIHYRHDDKIKNSLSLNHIISLLVDSSGNIWVGTENGGLNLFDKINKQFWHYRKDDFNMQSLNNESIQSLYQDRAGNLWVGTYTGGLNIAMKNGDAILSNQSLPNAPFSLSRTRITCFSEGNAGQLLIGTDGGGLFYMDALKNKFSQFNTDNSKLGSNAILCMLEDFRDKLWIGTWSNGLVNFDTRTNKFTSITTRNSGIQDDNIFDIAEGNNNDLWLGSFEHGLIHYEINEQKFTSFSTDNSSLSNPMVVKIKKFTNDRLLIGTAGGFQIFSPKETRFMTYLPKPNDSSSISHSLITDILVENDTCIWISTRYGLNRFNPVTNLFKRYYEKDGLPSNTVNGLIIDNSGILWVTTNKGICRFDYRNGNHKNFNKADGLKSNEFSERSILKLRDGELFMGCNNGFNIIYPEKIIQNKNIPDILITELRILSKGEKHGLKNSPVIQNITEKESLRLSHKQAILTFYFSVMDYTVPEKNQYAYRMEGFDDDWTYSGNKREVTYTNLNPGDYVFHVKGSNNDGLWNEKGSSIIITILPPWWKTVWFKILVGIVVILIFVLFYLSRVRQFKAQQIKLEEMVALKTIELKELNTSKDKFFSIIAHDLKNPFNSIIGFSDMLNEEIKVDNPLRVHEFARLINVSAVQTLKLLENLLEWAESQRGKIPFNPVLLKVNDLIEEEFLVLGDMAVAKNIALENTIQSRIVVFADRNMLKTVFRNLISNAIKFTHKNGKIEVHATDNQDMVEIAISDNGIGMSEITKAKLFKIDANVSTKGTENEKGTGLGLFLCKEFVEKHGGKIRAESKQGLGSVFIITLPAGVVNS
jgi:signal transduction histidine kinase/ligand-binding sensor domain-containing protein